MRYNEFMKRSAGLISLVYGLTTGIQIVGQIVVARLFGARLELDAFVSAVTIPTMLTSVIAATLSDAFLPNLKRKQIENEEDSYGYFFKMILLISFIILLITIGLDIFSQPLITALFGVRGISFVILSDKLMISMLYTIPFTVLGTFFNSYLYSQKKFFLPSIAYLGGSILNLALIIFLSQSLGIVSMVIGFICSIILQVFIVFPYKIRKYVVAAFISLRNSDTKKEIIQLFIAWSPLIVSSLILRFDSVLTRSFSARLPEGYIVYVNLVTKLFSGLVGIMTIGIQTVFFPHLIELIHTHNFKRAEMQVNKAKLFGIFLTIGTIAIIVIIAPFFMKLLLTGGKFSSKNVEILISMFPYFIVPALGWGIGQIFFQPIIAIGKQHLLTLINMGAVFLSWISATYAYNQFGGLAAISVGLIVLSFTGIIGAEILWKIESKKLLQTHK